MAAKGPIRGIREWLIHRLVANYWSLPMVAVFVAPIAAAFAIWLGARGVNLWLIERGLTYVASPDTAQDLLVAVVGINAALLTLYWSVTVIVLTLATASLGVRLVDRWLDKGLVRVSMAGLTFCLVYSIIILARIDPGGKFADSPHFALLGLAGLELVNIGMLGVAIHDLGRTMFVDRSISNLGTDAASIAVPVVGVKPFGGTFSHTIPAPREGYVEGTDLATLQRELAAHPGTVRFCAAPGQHILEGEPLVRFEHAPPDDDIIKSAIPIGGFRSSAQSTVYEVRLLVEVASRALSPGINDFYSAIACADQLAAAISGHAETWVEDEEVAAYAPAPRFELPGQDFRGLFEDPLASFRQAAADYPSVSIRMIDNYARLCALMKERDCPPGLLRFLEGLAEDLCEHACARAQYGPDCKAIERAFANFSEPPTALKAVQA